MKEIIRSPHSGFCFGVRQAIDKARKAAAELAAETGRKFVPAAETGKKSVPAAETGAHIDPPAAGGPVRTDSPVVNTCGMLIHNRRVNEDLRRQGIGIVARPEEAPAGSRIIVRSHGEPRRFYETAAERQLDVIDATCPFVQRIQRLVAAADEKGRQVILVGDRSHPEVQGINGWCRNRALIFRNADEVRSFLADPTSAEHLDRAASSRGAGDAHESTAEKEHRNRTELLGAEQSDHASLLAALRREPPLLAAQTTTREEVFEAVVAALRAAGIEPEVHNTICLATQERQNGVRETAAHVDLMLVVGDVTSSNTKKLLEIAREQCENSYFIENIGDLPLKEIRKYNRIGVAAGASTPEIAIKEVIANMSDKITETDVTMEDLMPDIEQTLRLPRSGELVTGKVIQVNDKEVIVNLGCKKDGVIPENEVSLEDGQTLTDLYHEGDEVQATVLKTDDGEGSILLSKKKLEATVHWGEINQALEDKSSIEVVVVRKVNGGVIAKYKEVSGFIPLSQLSDRYVEDAAEFVGQTLTVKVSRTDQRRNKAVFSHKAYLNEEKQKAMAKIWEKIHVGDIVEGTVMRFTDYGAFVDIGGIDGLLHISEISWGKLKHPREALTEGEKITVKILSMNQEKGKISLGLKQTTPEPWSVIDEHYAEGDVVEGKVVQVKEYGCFVELEPGLDGLVHISEINHHRVNNINDEVAIGDIVHAKILDIDKERRRISLSIKATLDPNAPAPKKKEKAKAEEPAKEAPAEKAETAEENAGQPAAEAAADEQTADSGAAETAQADSAAEAAADNTAEAAETTAETAANTAAADSEAAATAESDDSAAADAAEDSDDSAEAADSTETTPAE
ncbi:MAG: 30S ribosomal protein S1 [Anaerovoracaceae bacterium]|jgi:(E)-4-hydroxy-3-methyl-but-2-enyl pyrophosphate reductase